MAQIFPIDFEEKLTMAQDDYILFSDSEDGNKIKKAQYSNLKGEKGDTGTAATVSVGGTTTGAAGTSACVTNCGTTSAAVLCFTIPKGDKGDTGQTGPAIVNADRNGDDIDFTEEDGNVVTLSCAKVCLKGDKGDTGCTGPTGPSICAAAFNGNNIDFTETNGCVVTLTDAKTCLKGDTGASGAAATVSVGTTTTLDAGCCATVSNSGTSSAAVFNFGVPKGDKGDTGATGCTGPAGNGIACVTSTKAGKITTVDITCTNGCSYCFDVSDGEDGQGSGDMLKCVYDPNNINADAFNYCNFTNTPTIPTDNCQLANSCGYTTCTGTLTSANISNVAYGLQWSGVVTDAPSKKVMYDKLKTIDAIIPSAATCSNQLADKDYVNDSINSVTAYYITKNAAGDQFATYAELAAATTFYSGGTTRTPTRNDYAIVLDDENHDHATTRYIYNTNWEYQYTVNETALTTAQVNALNSGITSAKVTCYDSCMAQCCDIPTDNCQLCNGCGYTTCIGTVTSSDLASYVTNSCVACINGCCLTEGGDICIKGGGGSFIDMLIVGGGGAGSRCYNSSNEYGAGGGGGEVIERYATPIRGVGCYTITIGTGGNNNSYSGAAGTSTFFDIYEAHGGKGGCTGSGSSTGGASGAGFGGGGRSACAGGGGGGVRSGGSGGSSCVGGAGGLGVMSYFDGTLKCYGGGGGGHGCKGGGSGRDGGGNGASGFWCNACNGVCCGGGGGGAGGCNTGKGAGGMVQLRYTTDGSYGITCATGGTVTTACGFTIHTFTSNGTFEVIS